MQPIDGIRVGGEKVLGYGALSLLHAIQVSTFVLEP
jgi:hypothetical protein